MNLHVCNGMIETKMAPEVCLKQKLPLRFYKKQKLPEIEHEFIRNDNYYYRMLLMSIIFLINSLQAEN